MEHPQKAGEGRAEGLFRAVRLEGLGCFFGSAGGEFRVFLGSGQGRGVNTERSRS